MLSDEDIEKLNNDAREFARLLEKIDREVSRLNYNFEELIEAIGKCEFDIITAPMVDNPTEDSFLEPSIFPENTSK